MSRPVIEREISTTWFCAVCAVCGSQGPDALSETLACDLVRADNWNVNGRRAVCPDCPASATEEPDPAEAPKCECKSDDWNARNYRYIDDNKIPHALNCPKLVRTKGESHV